MTRDGRYHGLGYQDLGNPCCQGKLGGAVSAAIDPGGDQIIRKTNSSSVFILTSIDYVLRSLGVQQVILCRLLTDHRVESAVRDACDLGYLV